MPQTIHRGIKAMIDEANAEIETLSAPDAIKAAQRDDVVIVDIRDPREIERDGKIPGAFSCTRGGNSSSTAPAACARRLPPRRRRTWG
jgi:rhodanese-related sulfurtransferase